MEGQGFLFHIFHCELFVAGIQRDSYTMCAVYSGEVFEILTVAKFGVILCVTLFEYMHL